MVCFELGLPLGCPDGLADGRPVGCELGAPDGTVDGLPVGLLVSPV